MVQVRCHIWQCKMGGANEREGSGTDKNAAVTKMRQTEGGTCQ